MQALCRQYAKDAINKLGFEVTFGEKEVILDVPEEGVVLENGWKITPMFAPVVSLYATMYNSIGFDFKLRSFQCFLQIKKKQVDSFEPGIQVPCCQLNVEWTKPLEQPAKLTHKIYLKGAKKPHNWFLLDNKAPPQG